MDLLRIQNVSVVQGFSEVRSPRLIEHLCSEDPDCAPNGESTIRIDLIGLPGLGKSTLLRGLFAKYTSLQVPVFAIPEAADYAIKVNNLTLDTMEKFLSSFYCDAEELAEAASRRVPKLIVLREPAGVQNDAYLEMQRQIREGSTRIAKLAHAYRELLQWRQDLEASLWQLTKEPILRTLAHSGPWTRHFVVLTSGSPEKDLRLSVERQLMRQDSRLASIAPLRLCAYLAAIRGITEYLSDHGYAVLRAHPESLPDDIGNEIMRFVAYSHTA